MRDNKKKVVLFADVLEEDFDGVSITLNKIIASFPTDRFDLLIITPHPPKDKSTIEYPMIEIPYFKIPFQEGYRMGRPGKLKWLEERISEFGPDVVHFTSPSLMGKYAIKYGKKHNVPVMTIYHTHYPTYFRYYLTKPGAALFGGFFSSIMAWFYKNADLTLVPTGPVRKDLIKLGIDKDKMAIWGRAINANRFNPVYREENYFEGKIPKGHKTVLFVSRLIKEKNVSVLVEMYHAFKRKNKKVTMVVTGDGPEREALMEQMPDALFTGKQTGTELSKIYSSADLFFFPSASETFGNVVLEAMASGLPVVAANACGPSDIVKDGETGVLVKPGNIRMYYKHILSLLEDDHTRLRMGRAAFNYANAKTIDNLHAELWSHYERVIKSYHMRSGSGEEPIGEMALSYKES